MTSFVGREGEVEALFELLRQSGARLVTLTGPGGVGKTRLALRVAEAAAAEFPDGLWFVRLAPVRDPGLVAVALAQALGVQESAGRPVEDEIAAFLRDGRVLLVLDNFEQVVAAAPLVTGLLSRCRRLTVLVTSRERLRLSGEREVVVPPLSLRRAGGEAVALFVERARAVRPDFLLTDDNAAAVAEICARLDGLPLAIELAAARAKLFTPAALLGRLAQRLDLLSGGPRDAPARLRTMRDAITWSHDLLTLQERTLFRRLSVFVGGFTANAAATVADEAGGDIFELLASLVDKSLVGQAPATDDELRFAMLETIREYALERLAEHGEEAEVRGAHVAHLLELAERAEEAMRGPHQGMWLDRLEAEHDNLRAALSWSVERAPETALRLGAALYRFWLIRGHLSEGRGWLSLVVERGRERGSLVALAKALFGASWLASEQGDYHQAVMLGEESLAIARSADDHIGVARALNSLGAQAHRQGDLVRAMARFEECLAAFRALADADNVAGALLNLGLVVHDLGKDDRATALLEEALALFRARDNPRGVAMALQPLATLVERAGDADRAAALDEEALLLFRRIDDKHGQARTLHSLGHDSLRRGDRAGAVARFKEARELREEIGDRRGRLYWLEAMADLAESAGHPAEAVRLTAAAAVEREAIGYPYAPTDADAVARNLTRLRAVLGEAEYALAWETGRALSLDQAMDEAASVATRASSAPIQAPFGLTPRELDVLCLLALRYTDKEIGAALSISPRTVARHTTGIFAKLGVNSRREVAAVAARHGLA